MRIVKILLILLLTVVSVLYGMTAVSARLNGTDERPVLRCDTEVLDVSIHDGNDVLLSGITASDAQDGDLTGRIRISGISKLFGDHEAKVTCVVFDSDSNMATLTRRIRYTDYRAPRFSITEPLIYYMSESIALLDRIRATDDMDGDITSFVRVSPMRPTADPETYDVDVQVTNAMGDTVRLTLPVIQIESRALRPVVELSSYLVYIEQGSSFDAGKYLVGVELPDGGDAQHSGVQIIGSVDTATPGTYTVRYSYPYNGTSGSAILTVVVE